MNNIKSGFAKIELDKCPFYKDGRDFLRYAVTESLKLKKENFADNVKHKIALITSYTGLNFLLLSILQASIPNENQRKHVIYKRQLVVKNSNLTVSESMKTIETDELISRLKGCNFQVDDIAPKLREIAEIRNNVIHHFNTKPNEELQNHIISIFIIVNEIINDQEVFWGESWRDLIKIATFAETINKKCIKSYKENHFNPNYYFSCLSCGSRSLCIQKKEGSKKIKCETCQNIFERQLLVSRLTDSNSYHETHQIISLLSAFIDELDDTDLEMINMADQNSQVGDVIMDDDIYHFYIQVFSEEYFD